MAHFDVENVCIARAASPYPSCLAFDHNRKLTWRDLIDEPVDLLHARRTTDHIAIAMVADGKIFTSSTTGMNLIKELPTKFHSWDIGKPHEPEACRQMYRWLIVYQQADIRRLIA